MFGVKLGSGEAKQKNGFYILKNIRNRAMRWRIWWNKCHDVAISEVKER